MISNYSICLWLVKFCNDVPPHFLLMRLLGYKGVKEFFILAAYLLGKCRLISNDGAYACVKVLEQIYYH